MGKKRRREAAEGAPSSRNALRDARRVNAKVSKQEQKFRALWHRKTGAGYSLFGAYYGAQPDGCVVESSKPGAASAVPLDEPFARACRHAPHLARFIKALSLPLPLTFRLRFNYHRTRQVKEVREAFETEDLIHLIRPVAYDPLRSIYQGTSPAVCRNSLTKRGEHRDSRLRTVLMENTAGGLIARQELGSMLPVMALAGCTHGAIEKRSGHADDEETFGMMYGGRVLDLCASPGSKAMQALEIVGGNGRTKKKGRVVANDVNQSRLQALLDAVGRSGLPDDLVKRLVTTNHDASLFPYPKSGKLFDAVVADVPCSGDGTIRKDSAILPNWSPRTGNALHGLQLRILMRALELVRVGGTVAYSTCSLNPIEDEAVVSAAIRSANGTVELVDWPTTVLPGLVRRKGITNWSVADYVDDDTRGTSGADSEQDAVQHLHFYETYEDAVRAEMADAERSMWPNHLMDQQDYHLERCTRLWPQDQDTGGFFVALLQKMKPFKRV